MYWNYNWLYFNLWRLLLGKMKDRIDFRVLRGCLVVVVVGVVTQTPQILWSLAHFYHARQPTTNKKKNTWPQNCCRQRYPVTVATLEIQLSWYYKSTIKGRVIKGLQNLFPSALSFNHKTLLPHMKDCQWRSVKIWVNYEWCLGYLSFRVSLKAKKAI